MKIKKGKGTGQPTKAAQTAKVEKLYTQAQLIAKKGQSVFGEIKPIRKESVPHEVTRGPVGRKNIPRPQA